MITLDSWQRKVMDTRGNICVRSSRQAGKSTIISIKAAEYAANNSNKLIMVIAAVERQSYLLFEKILNYLYGKYKKQIKTGSFRPTKHLIQLKNGSRIYALPAGTSGQGIRGYTIDLLICDEAAYIGEDVFTAIIPALAVTKGDIWLLSTPKGKQGYFYSCFNDDNYTKFHIRWEECPRISREFIEQQKKKMTRLQFEQEFGAEFLDELRQFFPTELIRKCMTLPVLSKTSGEGSGGSSTHTAQQVASNFPAGHYYLGVDIARLGKDQTVLITAERRKERLIMKDMIITEKTYTTETVKTILNLDKKYKYKRIYIDDGGLGVAVFDPLLREEQTRRRVVAINNAARGLDREDKRKKKILKEDLYNNLLRLMEQGSIDLWDDEDLLLSLKSIQYEYDENGRLKIWGDYSHCCEALIRAAWSMTKKELNIWVRY